MSDTHQQFRPVGRATPIVEATVGAAVAAAAGAASAVRRARAFHPDGIAFHATLHVTGGQHGAALLDQPGAHPAVVRLSRGAGLPESLPDVLGLAMHIPDAHGPGEDQDLLLVSSWSPPLMRHALLPVRGFSHGRYSSVAPYRVGGSTVLFGARPLSGGGTADALSDLRDGAPPPRFEVQLAALRGPWQSVGVLELGRRLPDPEADALHFDPSRAGGGIRTVGLVQAVRRPAYRVSQGVRPTT